MADDQYLNSLLNAFQSQDRRMQEYRDRSAVMVAAANDVIDLINEMGINDAQGNLATKVAALKSAVDSFRDTR